ncbi:hypothetical protein AB4501_31380, partial [Vibrio sp. 10N.222.55.E8]
LNGIDCFQLKIEVFIRLAAVLPFMSSANKNKSRANEHEHHWPNSRLIMLLAIGYFSLVF